MTNSTLDNLGFKKVYFIQYKLYIMFRLSYAILLLTIMISRGIWYTVYLGSQDIIDYNNFLSVFEAYPGHRIEQVKFREIVQ